MRSVMPQPQSVLLLDAMFMDICILFVRRGGTWSEKGEVENAVINGGARKRGRNGGRNGLRARQERGTE